MRKFFTTVTVIFLGLVFVVFAVANRHFVTVSLDPFNSANSSISASMPLFVVMIAMAMLGVIAGSMMTWFRQSRWRRAARQHEADARQLRSPIGRFSGHRARPTGQRSVVSRPCRTVADSRRARQTGRDVVERARYRPGLAVRAWPSAP